MSLNRQTRFQTRRPETPRRVSFLHQLARRTQFSTLFIMEMGTTWFLWCRCFLLQGFFFLVTNKCCFALVVGGEGFHDNWDLGSQEILPSLMIIVLMMIAFITIKSSLVPLIEGLCAQIYFRFEISVVCSHLLLFFLVKEKIC